ncbi:MAG: hypothetical protein AABY22_17760 [Nanoarchaeota archaeon]
MTLKNYRHPPRANCKCCGSEFADLKKHGKLREFYNSATRESFWSTKCKKSHGRQCTGKCLK